jgi:hypothetical protein
MKVCTIGTSSDEPIGIPCTSCGHTNLVHPGSHNPGLTACALCTMLAPFAGVEVSGQGNTEGAELMLTPMDTIRRYHATCSGCSWGRYGDEQTVLAQYRQHWCPT